MATKKNMNDKNNQYLGHGDCIDQYAPRQIEKMKPIRCISAACGTFHSVVLTDCKKKMKNKIK
jgi:hypothetical protein